MTADYRDAPAPLRAEWIVEEADLHAAVRALPGSTLALVRWPIAFGIAYVGVGLSSDTGVAFTLGSAAVILAGWIVMSLGARGTNLRKQSRLPPEERRTRISIEDERVRLETASGRATEFPTSEIRHAKIDPTGILLDAHNQAFFIPVRALGDGDPGWRSFVERLGSRTWPIGIGFTIALWVFAAAVGAYGFLR